MIAVDGAGNVVKADGIDNRVRVVAARSGTFYGQTMTAGDIYTIAGDGQPGYSGDGGPATAATFAGTHGGGGRPRGQHGRVDLQPRDPDGGRPDGHVLRPAR